MIYGHSRKQMTMLIFFCSQERNTCNTCHAIQVWVSLVFMFTQKRGKQKGGQQTHIRTYYLYIQYSNRHKLSSFIFSQINRYCSTIIMTLQIHMYVRQPLLYFYDILFCPLFHFNSSHSLFLYCHFLYYISSMWKYTFCFGTFFLGFFFLLSFFWTKPPFYSTSPVGYW